MAITLQAKDVNAHICTGAVNATKLFLKNQHDNSSFTHFFESVTSDSENLTERPTLPRKRRAPRRFEQGSGQPHEFHTPADYFRQQYYETFDVLIQEIDTQFCQESLDVLQEMEDIVGGSCNGIKVIPSEKMKKIYGQELDFEQLESQLLMLPDLVKTENQKSRQSIPIKYILTISTVCEIFISNPFTKLMLSEVNKMLFLYLTAPMTSSTAERLFSSLRRLKTYLRSTMTQKKLNHIQLLHVHKQRTDEIDVHKIMQTFINCNSRRLSFFDAIRCMPISMNYWHFLLHLKEGVC